MAFKSVLRRSALITVSAASAVALAACGAGQISQTANQHPAVDGAMNGGEDAAGKGAENTNSALGFVNIRDAHILVDPEAGTAGLKFSASNQQRATESVYKLKSVTVEGIGEVELKKVAERLLPSLRLPRARTPCRVSARSLQVRSPSSIRWLRPQRTTPAASGTTPMSWTRVRWLATRAALLARTARPPSSSLTRRARPTPTTWTSPSLLTFWKLAHRTAVLTA